MVLRAGYNSTSTPITMEDERDYTARGARPRRQARFPERYKDYELEYVGFSPVSQEMARESTPRVSEAARAPFTPFYPNPPHFTPVTDPIHEMRENTDDEQDAPSGEGEHLTERGNPNGDKRSPCHYPDLTPTTQGGYEDELRHEYSALQRERVFLHRTQQRLAADISDFKTMQADMLRLMGAFRDLRRNEEERAPSSPPKKIDAEGVEWPPPPPPVCNDYNLNDEPVVASLDKMMEELRTLKKEVLTNKKAASPQTLTSSPSCRHQEYPASVSCPQAPLPMQPPVSSASFPEPRTLASAPAGEPRRPGLEAIGVGGPHPAPHSFSQYPRTMLQPSRTSCYNFSPDPGYHGPRPTIPHFTRRDPGEFAHLRMALENLLPAESPELFKYQILLDHLKLDEARLVAEAYLHSPTPFTDTMHALTERFGQPHQLALRKIAAVMDAPDVKRGDMVAFERFSLQIQSLVGMLRTLGLEGEVELRCGSHVARLLSKLPPEQRAEFRRCMLRHSTHNPTLTDLADWLKQESRCHDYTEHIPGAREDRRNLKPGIQAGRRSIAVYHGAENAASHPTAQSKLSPSAKPASYCAFCDIKEHHLSQCAEISKLSQEQLVQWIKTNKRCWRCARSHQAAQCNLKKLCNLCQGRHLQILHAVNTGMSKGQKPAILARENGESSTGVLYLDRPVENNRVLLKVIPVYLHYGGRTLDTFAVLDDGSERTMLLPAAAQALGVQGAPEALPLRTIRQDIQTLQGTCISFLVSPKSKPKTKYRIKNAFTATRIDLADHSYPMDILKRKYKHLSNIPIQPFKRSKPMLLIGSDHPHLLIPTEPVRLGPPGGPAAIHTRLGWTLQGPSSVICQLDRPQQCLLTSVPPQVNELMRHVERLWQTDVVPPRSDKVVTRSKQDNEAIALLESKTTRVEVDAVLRCTNYRSR